MLQRSKDNRHSGHLHYTRRRAGRGFGPAGRAPARGRAGGGHAARRHVRGPDGLLDLPRGRLPPNGSTGCPRRSRTRRTCSTSRAGACRTSRLSCQIVLSDALDGIEVRIPPDSHDMQRRLRRRQERSRMRPLAAASRRQQVDAERSQQERAGLTAKREDQHCRASCRRSTPSDAEPRRGPAS